MPDGDKQGIRTFGAVMSRIYVPIMAFWLYAMAVGRGFTVWLFSRPLVLDVLAPASYNIYLFHQWTGQMYWLITRNEMWSYWRYRKDIYWFSPYPVPVDWWEYFFLVGLTTYFATLLAKVDPTLVLYWNKGVKRITSALCKAKGSDLEPTTLDIVQSVVCDLTGTEVEPDWTIAECGLSSVAGPVLINMLTEALPGTSIAVADLLEVETIEEMAALLEMRKQEAGKTGV